MIEINHLPSASLPMVLIVDDVATNIKILAETLRDQFRIKVASNGADALEIALAQPQPDLILLDIMMPDMDGYEVCRRLKGQAQTSHIPIIFVTAKSSADDEEFGFNLGAADYINKPFSLSVVKARVRNHVALKQQADALAELSRLDQLTQIPNRRAFDESLATIWAQTVREQQPLSLLMLDIDHFKDYNSQHGHGGGDECLRQVAAALQEGLPLASDRLARYGGEEFVILLPNTASQAAAKIAEQLRKRVEQLALKSPVSISIGVATGMTESAAQWLEQADQMLYRAKESGRNRVCVASELG